jgi:DNA polymerase elongation subunit (family B)
MFYGNIVEYTGDISTDIMRLDLMVLYPVIKHGWNILYQRVLKTEKIIEFWIGIFQHSSTTSPSLRRRVLPRPEPVGSKVRLENAKAAPGDPVRVFLEIWEDLGSINHPGSSNSLRPRSLCGRTRRDGLKRCWKDQVVTLGRKRDRENGKKNGYGPQ